MCYPCPWTILLPFSPDRTAAETNPRAHAQYPEARVFAASMKDRSAIFLGGLRPDAAFWYNASIGGWRSSSYYLAELPAWVEDFNARRDLDAYLETVWRPLFGKDQKRFRY